MELLRVFASAQAVADYRVSGYADEATGLAHPHALDDVLQDGDHFVLRQARVEQGGTLSLRETGFADAAAQEPALLRPVAQAHGQVAVPALTVRGARQTLAAKTAQIVIGWPSLAHGTTSGATRLAPSWLGEYNGASGCAMLRSHHPILKEIENQQGKTELKYLLASEVLSGSAFDKGRNPYQDFATLIKLRNDIMHAKPEKATVGADGLMEAVPRPHIKALQQRKIASATRGVSSYQSVMTAEMATWACWTARNMMMTIWEMVPEGTLEPMVFAGQYVLTNDDNWKTPVVARSGGHATTSCCGTVS